VRSDIALFSWRKRAIIAADHAVAPDRREQAAIPPETTQSGRFFKAFWPMQSARLRDLTAESKATYRKSRKNLQKTGVQVIDFRISPQLTTRQ
jgi:hypothetical protein